MSTDPIVILSYARTPMGSFQGALSGASATDLGAAAAGAAVERAGIAPDAIEKIYMGCVLPAGLGQAPARQAALGRPAQSVEATTVKKSAARAGRPRNGPNDPLGGEIVMPAAWRA